MQPGQPVTGGPPPQYQLQTQPQQYQPQVVVQQYTPPTTTPAITYIGAHQNTGGRPYEKYNQQTSYALGGIQIAIAALHVLFNSLGYTYLSFYGTYFYNGAIISSYGIWGSIFFLLSGGFALGAASHRTSCMIQANLALSILSAVVAFIGLSLCIAGVTTYGYYPGYSHGADAFDHRPYSMVMLLLILSLAELMCAIWSSALCCAVLCCGARAARAGSTTLSYIPGTTGQMAVGNPGYQVAGQHP